MDPKRVRPFDPPANREVTMHTISLDRFIRRLTLVALLAAVACSDERAAGVVIVNNGVLRLGSLTITEEGFISQPQSPGVVVLFRTTEVFCPRLMGCGTAAPGDTGRVGNAYVITVAQRLRRIGSFDVSRPDSALIQQWKARRVSTK
jgi:hypothetical protein